MKAQNVTYGKSVDAITIDIDEEGRASCSTKLIAAERRHDDPFQSAVDGLTTLLLSMGSAGVVLDTPEMHKAVAGSLEHISNDYE